MPDSPLAGEVTRPADFDAAKDYGVVIARGDQWLGDYDINTAQRIVRQDLAVMSRLLFREGAVLLEAGGTISAPVNGVVLGADTLGSAGTYRGLETQLYTVTVAVGGLGGIARYTWSSTGADNPDFPGQEFEIRAIAASLLEGVVNLALYGHAVGALGAQVIFVNPNRFVTAPNSWIVQATYGAQPPVPFSNFLVVSDLLVPVQGRVHRVAGDTLTYPVLASGISTVYGEWTRTVVTHADDDTLRDPLSDTPQAWRERWRMVLRTTDTSGDAIAPNVLERRVYALYRWDRATDVVTPVIPNPYAINIEQTEGAIPATRLLNIDQNETFRGTLARRTAGAHGSFVVSPVGSIPRARRSTNAATPGKIRLAIPPIIASVEGVEVRLDAPTEIEIDQALDFGSVVDEPHTYTAAANPFALNKSLGDNPLPIKAVTQLTAQVRIGNPGVGGYEGVTRDPGDLFDTLAATPVVDLIRVSNTQGGPADYTENTHYQLTGNQIEWIHATRPANGVTYFVVYDYQKVMVQGVDFVLTGAGAIDFAAVGGDEPVTSTVFQTDYEYYLRRHDAIVLRPTGELAVIRGLPAELPADAQVPLLTLPYVRVAVPPNSVDVGLFKYPNDRVTMERLNQVIAALDELTINDARTDLTTQARARTTASLLDVLAEAFATLQIADETYNISGITYDALVDTEVPELTVPFTQTAHNLTKIAPPAGHQDVRIGKNFWTLPYTPELAIDAPRWSAPYPVNPYADFRPEPPVMALEPSLDIWIDTITLTSTRTRTVQNGAHRDASIVGVFSEVQTRVAEIPFLHARQIQVRVEAGHFVQGEKVRLRFDGKDVTFTAAAPTVQGADAFTLIANADGTLVGTCTVPVGVPAGAVLVQLFGDQAAPGSTWPASYSVRAAALYTSLGTLRLIASETIITVVQNDPIAQSITFPAARMIARVDIPMASKPGAGTTPLIFEVRGTDRAGRASTPVDEVLARVSRQPTAVNVGPSSSNVYDLADPVMVFPNEFRALVLRSATDQYAAYVAQLGEADRTAGGFIQQNQIDSGIFMDSSNNTDWTLRQGWDLRCKVYVVKCSPLQAYLYFTRVNAANSTAFFLAPDQVVPDGTSIEWQVSTDGKALTDGTKVWTTFAPATLVELAAVTGTLDVRAILRTTDPYVTPSVNRFNTALLVQSNKTSSRYVTRQKRLTADATRILGGVWVRNAPGGSTTVFVSVDDGATWSSVTLTADGSGTAPDGYTAYRFDKTGLAPGQRLRVRIDQSTPDRAQRPRGRNVYAYAQPA